MRTRKIAIILLLVLIGYAAIRLLSLDYATSIIPGWHTTIYPIDIYGSWIILILAPLVLVALWIMARRKNKFRSSEK